MHETNPNLPVKPPSSPRWMMIRKKLEAASRACSSPEGCSSGSGVTTSGWWRDMIRIHGKKTYRCIYLGDADMAERTRELLQQWREERITPQERQQQARLQALDETAVALGFSGGDAAALEEGRPGRGR